MANTVAISKTHLIYGVCLPLAVLLGYLLSEPFESGSVAVVFLVFCVLCVPMFMRWHHPLLIFSCNAAMVPYFIPGHIQLWIIMASISIFFLVLNRSLGQNVQFFLARRLAITLIFLGLVVLITAYSAGGIGFGTFGSRNAGGKKYISIFAAIIVYFALSTVPISRKWARLAVAVFFLSMLTNLISYIAALGGPGFYFLVELFPIQGAVDETSGNMNMVGAGIVRLGELGAVAMGIFCFLLSRYGLRGTLDLTKPWRLFLMLAAVGASLFSGFRSQVIIFILIFGVMFYVEGLFRTRYFPMLILTTILGAAICLPFAQKLPLSVQRSLCFLPINVDPIVRNNAEDSTDWRIQMWREVIPTIPQYLIKGKGYVMDMDDMYMLLGATRSGFNKDYDGAMLAGDYHSGPLSVIVPFGLFGVFGFLWFLVASVKVLLRNFRYGDPYLHTINMFFLSFFIARIIFFFFIFGSLYSDLVYFTSIMGLSVSINHGVASPKSTEQNESTGSPVLEPAPQFS